MTALEFQSLKIGDTVKPRSSARLLTVASVNELCGVKVASVAHENGYRRYIDGFGVNEASRFENWHLATGEYQCGGPRA